MENSKELKRIYRIEVLGIEAATKKVEQLNQEINLQTQIKKEAQKILIANPGDVAQIEKQSKVIAESEVNLKKLNAEKRIAIKETDAMIRVQEREVNAQIKLQEQTGLAVGSYKALFAESKRLNELYRNTAPTNPLFTKIKAEAIAAQQKVHDFNRTLASEGTLVGEYSRGIINAFKSADMGEILKAQVKKGEIALQGLDNQLDQLKISYNEARKAGTEGLQAIEKELIDNRKAALELQQQVGTMKTELKAVGGVGSQLSSELKQGFKGLTSDLINTAIAFVGIQAAISGVRSLVQNTAQLADAQSDLEINLNKSVGGADKLTDALSKLNTRTKLLELENIANIAIKAGVSENNLLSVTEAIDKVKIAFGKDFGDVEQGTEAIVKIIGIFEGAENLTGEKFTQVGNAIRTLANESVASVPYLNDFTQRIAGLEQIAKVGLPNTLGLASGFEQFGQSAETSSTVLIKLIPKLASDVEQFAKYAGLSAKGFKDLLESDPTEALLRFSEGIVKNKTGLVQLEEALKDSEIFGPKGGGRGAAILGVLGGKADIFRKSIESAKAAMQDTGAIEDAFNKKNENFAATLDKISKKFADLGNNKQLQSFLIGLAGAVTFLLGNLQIAIPLFLVIIGLTNTLAGSVLRLTAAMILERAARVIEIIQLGVSNTIRATATLLVAAYTAALAASTFATGKAAIAYRLLAATIAFLTSPLAIVIGLVVGLTTVFGVMSSKAESTSKKVGELATAHEKLAAQQRIHAELTERVSNATGDLVSKIRQYTFIAGDASLKDEVRRAALQKLIDISPTYRAALNGEVIDITKLTAASDLLIESLQKQARVKAFKELFDEKTKKQFELENRIAGQYTPIYGSDGKTIVGKEVRNKDNSLYGAVKSLFVDNEVATLEKNQEELKQINIELEQMKTTLNENKDLQTAIVTDATAGGTSVVTGAADKEAKKRKKTAEQIRNERLNDLKNEENAAKQLNEIRFKTGKQSEIQYLENLNGIVQKYSDLKLAVVLKAAKEEKHQINEFQLDKINSEKDTNEKIFKIKSDALILEQKEFTASTNAQAFAEDEAQRKLEVDEFNKKALIKYQNELLSLQNQYHIKNIENEKNWAKQIKDINEAIRKDQVDVDKARLADAKRVGDEQLSQFKAWVAAKRLELANAGKVDKNLDRIEIVGTVARELAALNVQMPLIKKLYEQGIVSAKEYYDFLAARDLKAAENAKALTAAIKKTFADRLKIFATGGGGLEGGVTRAAQKGSKKLTDGKGDQGEIDAQIATAIGSAFDLATQAMNNYYDSKRARVEEELEYELSKLELEKEQKLSRAQSRDEELSIIRQNEKAKREAEKKAFEEKKKIKKSEAKLAFLSEIANIWSNVWSVGIPWVAIALGGVMTALAGVRYANTISGINKERFAQGGWVGQGGMIEGPSHRDGGVPFKEAEGGELAIINKNTAKSSQVYSVTGTAKQIASSINQAGGGVGFAAGGKIAKLEYGGILGKGLSIPGDVSYLHNNGTKEMIEAINTRIDNIKVFVVAKEVETTNIKTNKAAQINSL